MSKVKSGLLGTILVVLALIMVACVPKGGVPLTGGATEPLGMFFSQQQVGVWVNGEGKATAVPDVAILSVGVEAQAPTVAQAQADAAGAMDKVMKALKGNGVQEKDIQTRQFSIYPIWRWIEEEKREEIIGYRVTNMVTAEIRALDKTGVIIDAVAEAGGDFTRIHDISFAVDDPAPYLKKAREKAVKDAVARAKEIAEAAGIKLGKPIYISEGAVYVPPPVRYEAYAKEVPTPAPPTPVSPGELEITLTVQMVYEID